MDKIHGTRKSMRVGTRGEELEAAAAETEAKKRAEEEAAKAAAAARAAAEKLPLTEAEKLPLKELLISFDEKLYKYIDEPDKIQIHQTIEIGNETNLDGINPGGDKSFIEEQKDNMDIFCRNTKADCRAQIFPVYVTSGNGKLLFYRCTKSLFGFGGCKKSGLYGRKMALEFEKKGDTFTELPSKKDVLVLPQGANLKQILNKLIDSATSSDYAKTQAKRLETTLPPDKISDTAGEGEYETYNIPRDGARTRGGGRGHNMSKRRRTRHKRRRHTRTKRRHTRHRHRRTRHTRTKRRHTRHKRKRSRHKRSRHTRHR